MLPVPAVGAAPPVVLPAVVLALPALLPAPPELPAPLMLPVLPAPLALPVLLAPLVLPVLLAPLVLPVLLAPLVLLGVLPLPPLAGVSVDDELQAAKKRARPTVTEASRILFISFNPEHERAMSRAHGDGSTQ